MGAERGKEERSEQSSKLEALIKKHEDLIPTVSKTQVKVDLYWKCYAFGDELKPHIEFLDGIMLSSTRDIAPSCIENVEELNERQSVVSSEISSPKADNFLRTPTNLSSWTAMLVVLNNTKAAWEGYGAGLENIAVEFDKAEEEIKKVKKRFNLAAACEDLEKRQKIFGDTKGVIDGMYGSIQHDYDVMTMTLPEDKKDFVKKEVKGVTDKLEVLGRFKEKVDKIDEFVTSLKNFDVTLKDIDAWMKDAEHQLGEIKNASDKMAPEDRVSYTMELQEDVAAKVVIIKKSIEAEGELLPQGDKVPQDAQDYKDELKRIKDFVDNLHQKVMKECDNFSEDVKYWAEYKTGIKEFKPWLDSAEVRSKEGLGKPQTLDEANAMFANVNDFDKACSKHLQILYSAQ